MQNPPIDQAILEAFYSANGESVSGEELAEKLKISRTAVWAHIAEFRKLGYVFESQPNVGYRLMEMPDLLLSDDLMARLSCGAPTQPGRGNPRIIGREIIVYRETSSTNDRVAERARQDAPEGLVIFAEKQIKGRGRMQRHWESRDQKGLWFSFLTRHPLSTRSASQLTIMATLAVVRALSKTAGELPFRIKWPNDIYCRGKKIAGILTEIEGDLDRITYAVIGIGINVNHEQADFSASIRNQASSLAIETGQRHHRPELAAQLLESIDEHYRQLREGAFKDFLHEWNEWDEVLGKQITVRTGNRTISGQATHLDEDGALVVRLDSGVNERVTSGDLSIEKV